MKELVLCVIAFAVGYGISEHNHGKDLSMPKLSDIPGLSAEDDAGTPKEVHPKFPERPRDMKHHASAMSM
jgi:hypothetical protein